MKTFEFILLLWDADPRNECEVTVGNLPVTYCDRQPYYYDGRMQFVERDPETNVPIRCGWRPDFSKVKIFYEDVEEVLLDYPECEVITTGLGQNDKEYKAAIEKWRQAGRDFQEWRVQAQEQKDAGKPITFPKRTWRQRFGCWLIKLGERIRGEEV